MFVWGSKHVEWEGTENFKWERMVSKWMVWRWNRRQGEWFEGEIEGKWENINVYIREASCNICESVKVKEDGIKYVKGNEKIFFKKEIIVISLKYGKERWYKICKRKCGNIF